ncbi:FAD binding domain-containing protein [Burkholderia territorii]|uniref:FAD binding domain-containing protein n=1 Tax=Burkholderia territorii TaxID=1503055 RepID=UPI000757A690|nr:FAD binding domain-containing protein [Burkholderia territorii]KWE30194.1 molybdopterin dehydrogenase [Burkholderia territorii]KWE37193.1 molybdopterin dehydrogenase [Burkholderia territorii]KWE44528.1 molybdopterin dehydrogenase [Burkholderia territorii]
MTYVRATTIDEVLGTLSAQPRPRIVCGATDTFADIGLVPARSAWLDISRVDALRGIEQHDGVTRIGAAATWDAIARTAWLPVALTDAAASIGPRQIRVQGTIGGNVCHASAVADGIPALLALDASVELASVRGMRRLPLAAFLVGHRRTALEADELLIAVQFERPRAHERTSFTKCTNRDGPAIAVVSAAARLRLCAGGTIEAAAVAVGGASDVARRMHVLEHALAGRRCDELAGVIATSPLAELSPGDDCRATALHRLHLARLAITRAFTCCIEENARGASAA